MSRMLRFVILVTFWLLAMGFPTRSQAAALDRALPYGYQIADCGPQAQFQCCPDGSDPSNNSHACPTPSYPSKKGSGTPNFDSANIGLFNGAGILFPSLSFFQNLASQFAQKAKDDALRLYGLLFTIELSMFAIQFLLFRGDNVGEFFSSLTFKIFVAGFFIWLITNAANVFPMIIASFTQAGQGISGTDVGGVGTLAAQALILASSLIVAASVAQAADQIEGGLEGIQVNPLFWVPGLQGAADGDMAVGFGGNIGHMYFIEALIALAFLVIGSLLVIVMTMVIITVESYIVLSAGILFLGFAGTRFTMSYAQGFMTYSINVGAKMFTFLLVVAVENAMLSQNTVASYLSLAPIFAAAVIPNGITALLALPFAIFLGFEFTVLSTIAFAIPSFAGSFLSGASSLSSTSALGSAMNTMNAAGQMMDGFRSAISSGVDKLSGGKSPEDAIAVLEQREASAREAAGWAPSGKSAANHLRLPASSGSAGHASSGQANPSFSIASGARPGGRNALGLEQRSPSKIKGMSPQGFYQSFFHTDPARLNEDQRAAVDFLRAELSTAEGLENKTPDAIANMPAHDLYLAYFNTNVASLSDEQKDAVDEMRRRLPVKDDLQQKTPLEIKEMSPKAVHQAYFFTNTASLSGEQKEAIESLRQELPQREGLEQKTAAEIQEMSAEKLYEAYFSTDASLLSEDQQKAIDKRREELAPGDGLEFRSASQILSMPIDEFERAYLDTDFSCLEPEQAKAVDQRRKALYASGATGGAGGAPETANAKSPSSGASKTLNTLSPAHILDAAALSALECAERYMETRPRSLSEEQRKALKQRMRDDKELRRAIHAINRERRHKRVSGYTDSDGNNVSGTQDKINIAGKAIKEALLPLQASPEVVSGPGFGSWREGEL